MYERFYGLRERPFELTADPRYVFLSATHREALSTLLYGIRTRKGITVLAGEAGTGKTMLLRALMSRPMPVSRLAYVSNPVLTREDFFAVLAGRFGLSRAAAASKMHFLAELQQDSLARQVVGGSTALVLDEAQSLSYELLEEVRLLMNLETTTQKLLSVVLCGQPELTARLNHASLRQLKQRVTLRYVLRSLTREETGAYIAARVRIAGGSGRPLFTPPAVDLIHQQTGGIPRIISVICDNALVSGFATRRAIVDIDIVTEVCRDFDLSAYDGAVEAPALTVSYA
ncbi:MAG: AAA family ATPase [Acidobacteria bacterium]|nr:AAA family ATPase [Acidobacteriota bacterium]